MNLYSMRSKSYVCVYVFVSVPINTFSTTTTLLFHSTGINREQEQLRKGVEREWRVKKISKVRQKVKELERKMKRLEKQEEENAKVRNRRNMRREKLKRG